uniref:Globin domain-containing protein n=1 Tax=Daphnia galeata TaxID=27404 RepID=A0A8J2WC96_9CRUS|nr:unnamed protein product [Daphnia galeata]
MEDFKSANVDAVQNTWAIIKQDTPQFYVALLTAHQEYQALFPAFANVPVGELFNNADLHSLSVKVFARLSELIVFWGNADALISKLIDLAHLMQHKGRGTTQAHFDNAFVVLMNFLAAKLGSAFDPEAKQAWTVTIHAWHQYRFTLEA